MTITPLHVNDVIAKDKILLFLRNIPTIAVACSVLSVTISMVLISLDIASVQGSGSCGSLISSPNTVDRMS